MQAEQKTGWWVEIPMHLALNVRRIADAYGVSPADAVAHAIQLMDKVRIEQAEGRVLQSVAADGSRPRTLQ